MRPDPSATHVSREAITGGFLATAAFLVWSAYPIYFKSLGHVPAFELMCHRVVWSVIVLAGLLSVLGRWRGVAAALRNRRLLGLLVVTALLVSASWVIYIWAVVNDNVLETSLAFYINPLMNMALGMAVLRERLSRWQNGAVLLAALGVGYLVVQHGRVPWVALGIALTFSVYGLMRKMAIVDTFAGLFLETAILFVPTLGYLVYIGVDGSGAFARQGFAVSGLLALSGVWTIVPLLLFTAAAKRLRYASVGFFQYVLPTCLFLLAVFVYREPITADHLVTFGCIWTALAIYTADTSAAARRAAPR